MCTGRQGHEAAPAWRGAAAAAWTGARGGRAGAGLWFRSAAPPAGPRRWGAGDAWWAQGSDAGPGTGCRSAAGLEVRAGRLETTPPPGPARARPAPRRTWPPGAHGALGLKPCRCLTRRLSRWLPMTCTARVLGAGAIIAGPQGHQEAGGAGHPSGVQPAQGNSDDPH